MARPDENQDKNQVVRLRELGGGRQGRYWMRPCLLELRVLALQSLEHGVHGSPDDKKREGSQRGTRSLQLDGGAE